MTLSTGMARSVTGRLFSVLLASGSLIGCRDSTSPTEGATVRISGGPLVGVVGEVRETGLVFEVRSRSGRPLAGFPLTVHRDSRRIVLTPDCPSCVNLFGEHLTDAAGRVSFSVRFGTLAGDDEITAWRLGFLFVPSDLLGSIPVSVRAGPAAIAAPLALAGQ